MKKSEDGPVRFSGFAALFREQPDVIESRGTVRNEQAKPGPFAIEHAGSEGSLVNPVQEQNDILNKDPDIVKISDEEIEFLWGLSPEQGAEKLFSEYGVSLVYVTLGPKGCYAATRNHRVLVESPRGIHVVDTTGAGDIFGGSAMSRFLKTGKTPEDLTEEEMRRIVRFACTAASLSTQHHGGISSVPAEADVLEKMAE